MKSAPPLQSGAVARAIDCANLGLDAGYCSFAGGGIGDIEGAAKHGQALGAQASGGGLQLGRIAPIQYQAGAGLAQTTRQRQTVARGRAGDQGEALFEAEGGGSDHGVERGERDGARVAADLWSKLNASAAICAAGRAMSKHRACSSAAGSSRVSSWLSSSEAGM